MSAVAHAREGLRGRSMWRPSVSQEGLALPVSLLFTLACNTAFWRAYAATGALESARGWVTAASLATAMTGLHFLLLCLVLNRWTTKPLLSLLLVVTALAGYYSRHYGVYLDPDMIRNILHTDTREARELLTPGLALPVLAALIPVALVWWARIRAQRPADALLRRVVVMVAVATVTAGALLLSFQDISALMRNRTELRHLIAPGNYLVSLARVASEDPAAAVRARQPLGNDARVVGRSNGKQRVLVIVVGETVRAQNWGLNGYARQTTPELADLDVLNYTDVTACGSSTDVSLPCMFSAQGRRGYDKRAIRESESLLNVLDHAGIATLWRDNQGGCKGVCAGLPFESMVDARVPELCNAEHCLDEVLLHDLHARIDGQDRDQVIVLHQLGNHGPSYFQRYPDQFRQFVPVCESADLGKCRQAEIVNAYDNAILYTDHFLARVIETLEADPTRDSAMIYISDHGESLGEGNLYLHGMPYAIAPDTQLKVPMVMWLSPPLAADRNIDIACMRQRLVTPATHDNLFSSVLGLMQVETGVYDASQDLFAPCMGGAHI
ncbi:phosphoethanolamine--lipid A transferase [Lysobacter sp. A03]|uniref:phosphoethanolamine transferase n=1 Tax=Lysobacter sp. A03 TaxID=1199154 RepID=UPI0005B69E4A|nr:phosphoethanolamine--lipid A transferase [Lysobacter sp. A03]KIQ96536.1 inner membrane protein [Lysobacter sp. A03]